MGTAEHIRLVRPAHVHRELNERRRDYNVAYLGGGGVDLFRDHHMLVQLVGYMKGVSVSKSSKVTLAVIISRVLVL